VVVWLVADSEAISYQDIISLIKGKALKYALRRQLTIPHVVRSAFLSYIEFQFFCRMHSLFSDVQFIRIYSFFCIKF